MSYIRIEGQRKRLEASPPKNLRVTVILKKALHDFLSQEAKRAGTTRADFLRMLLEGHELLVARQELVP